MTSRVYYTKPSITAREIEYATDAAAHGWGDRCYEYIGRFEDAFRAHLGVRRAIATSSCTGALHLGLAGLGIGPGDEVIVADINWIASVAPVLHAGATPVLVDIDPVSWCLDPARVEAAITAKTRAILAVHLYGNLCDMDALQSIAARRDIPIIEDAAEALGSVWRGRRAGSMGAFATFSFHGSKTVTTGEGGMFVCNDDTLYERVLTLSNHGRARGDTRQFWPAVVGYKFKISNLQAAVGLAQIERIDELVARKRWIFEQYAERLHGLPVRMNPEPAQTTNGYWMPTIVIDENVSFNREALTAAFAKRNIDGRVFFWPLSRLGLPGLSASAPTPIAARIFDRAMNLPSYHDLTSADIDRVVEAVRSVIRG